MTIQYSVEFHGKLIDMNSYRYLSVVGWYLKLSDSRVAFLLQFYYDMFVRMCFMHHILVRHNPHELDNQSLDHLNQRIKLP